MTVSAHETHETHEAHEAPCAPGVVGGARQKRILQAKAVLSGIEGASLDLTLKGVMPGRQFIPLGSPSFDESGMDSRLPGGGLIKNALHEVRPLTPQDAPAATAFLLGLAARLTEDNGGLVVWVRPQGVVREWGLPYGPGLGAFGLSPARILFIHPRTEKEAFWAVEEALQVKGIALVIGDFEGKKLTLTASRRIHLAAENVGTPALVARSYGIGATAALTRWAVKAAPSTVPDYSGRRAVGGIGRPRWHVDLERAKGGRPGAFQMEWDYATHHFCLVSALGHRPAGAHFQPANTNTRAVA